MTAIGGVRVVGQEAADELVDEARLAGAAGAGDAEDRRLRAAGHRRQAGELGAQPVAGLGEVLGDGDQPRDGRRIALGQLGQQRLEVGASLLEVAALQQVVDHPLQAHRAAVVRRVDARDAVGVELLDLRRQDRAAAAAEDLDLRAAPRAAGRSCT